MEGRDVGKRMEGQQDTLLGLPPRKTRLKNNKKQAQKKQANRTSTEKLPAKNDNEESSKPVKASTKLTSGGGWKVIVPLAGAVVVAGVLFIWKEMNTSQTTSFFSENHTRTDAIASGTGISVTVPEPLVNREGADQSNVATTGIQKKLDDEKPTNNSSLAMEGEKGEGGTKVTAKPIGSSTPSANKPTADQKTSPASVPPSNKPEPTKSEQKPEKKIKSKLYKVKRGDNLHKISRAYYGNNNGVNRIATFNGLDTEAPLIEGKTLYIPVD
ncbi:LysM peptidoglycan-binding domain-containing protein [Brevibacillus laterosporus]|uniref:LysM peptidoglycan-binding domain-containing protein n=1 Tax=Brevibacillus laterosporus TaxID=1465 RepID=UPI00241E869F|nr:LysM peptidoglycan-binding domain-containing protein [Brevibacillus laterosporus]